ncbi:MAG: glycosyltransferase [Bryobacteraceae bacterium]
MSRPLVSVIIPTYNRATTVISAIDSVLAQTYTNLDVIVIDDGSTDGTESLLEQRYSSRIRVIVQANAGPAAARNRGIDQAEGELIAFLDSDDSWLPTKLERQVELLNRAGSDVACCLCNCKVIYPDGTTSTTFDIAKAMPSCPSGLWLNPSEVLLTRFIMFSQAALVRRDVLRRIGSFDESLRFGEDYELPLRISLEGPWVILRDELVIYHASSPGSWAQKALREEVRLRRDLVQIRQQIFERIISKSLGRGLRRLARLELSRAKRDLVHTQLIGKTTIGAAVLGRSLRFVERIRRAISRRSPFYPSVETVALS